MLKVITFSPYVTEHLILHGKDTGSKYGINLVYIVTGNDGSLKIIGDITIRPLYGAWRSLVARLLWEQEVGGSNPPVPMGEVAQW